MSTIDLSLARAAYAGASRLALKMWEAAKELNNVELTLSADFAIDAVAEAIYYNSSYTAGEVYDSIEEFKESFDLNDIRGFERNGNVYFVRPFFSGGDMMREVGFGYLIGGIALDELNALNCDTVISKHADWPQHLAPYEVNVLIKHYMRETITLLNTMRKLRVAMNYIEKGLTNAYNTAPSYAKASKNEALIESLVKTLIEGTTIAGLPAAPSEFSSNNRYLIRLLPNETIHALTLIA